MYHKIAIGKLSHAQIGKLLNGHRIRVKHGNGHEIHASQEQHKKIHKAHLKGCGTTIQFDPYQIQNHQHMRGKGEGFFGDLAKGAVKTLAPIAIDALSDYAKSKVGSGAKGARKGRRGKGVLEDMNNVFHQSKHFGQHTLAPVLDHMGVLPPMDDKTANFFRSIGIGNGMSGFNHPYGNALNPAGTALHPAGYGGVVPDGLGAKSARKVGRPRGRGFFGDLAKGAIKTLAPVAIDALSGYAKSQIGSGAKGARKGRRGKGEGVGGAKGARKGRRGKGVGEDILNGIQQYAPLALSFL